MQRPPREAGSDLADWHWKVVRQFGSGRFGRTLTHSSCHNYLHRLGFPASLAVFWDNAPVPGGAPLREYLSIPDLRLPLVRLPAYSPDFNADEPIWAWVRAEVAANTCFGTAAQVRAHVDPFFAGLAARTAEVKQHCRTALQSRAHTFDAVRAATTTAHHVQQAA